MVVGELATNPAVGRIRLQSLSLAGVSAMAGTGSFDVESLYRRTNGNPFFVTEVLAAPSEAIPLNVRDAVIARVSRLDAERALLDSVAVVPLGCEYWLLERVTEAEIDHLDTCLASGVLVADTSRVRFRHELARLTIEQELLPSRSLRLHQRTLEALRAAPAPDPARLVHHAVAASDAAAVARYAPEAGARAAALGAHREAAAHYQHAIHFTTAASPRSWATCTTGERTPATSRATFPQPSMPNVRRSTTIAGPVTNCASVRPPAYCRCSSATKAI